jgi:hypothetical protein
MTLKNNLFRSVSIIPVETLHIDIAQAYYCRATSWKVYPLFRNANNQQIIGRMACNKLGIDILREIRYKTLSKIIRYEK